MAKQRTRAIFPVLFSRRTVTRARLVENASFYLFTVHALTYDVLGRLEELGLLRAVGMFRSQLTQMVAVESVVIATSPALLTTQEATTGGVIENRMVANLPLSGRNWDDLIALVPGVQADRYTEESGSTANGRTGGANVHGVRSLQNNYVLDGVDNNSISENVQELTTQVARPSVDSIQEFKVITSPYSAEYGRNVLGTLLVGAAFGVVALYFP